jgi:8-amino-7-oxononanoate synthase
MMNLQPTLSTLQHKNLFRKRRTIHSRNMNIISCGEQTLLNFSGNDYLGLAQDQRVQVAFAQGINAFGFGSGSSAHISGYSRLHQQLEEQFANFLGRERALLFNSGYHANLGVLSTFADRRTPVFADKQSHASLIDGIVLSRAPHYRFHHQDLLHAETLLSQHAKPDALLVTESIFSMDGAITPIDKILALAKKYRAIVMIDDAHGFGVLGPHGRGGCEEFDLLSVDVPILITPLGKALAGMGAVVSGNHDLIETLVQKARTYCYSTALPPAMCSAALTALTLIESEPWRVTNLRRVSEFFNREASKRDIKLFTNDPTPIKCIATKSNQHTLNLQNILIEHGRLVAAIRPPTVPNNTSRLRISLNTLHTEANIIGLLDLIAEHYDNIHS